MLPIISRFDKAYCTIFVSFMRAKLGKRKGTLISFGQAKTLLNYPERADFPFDFSEYCHINEAFACVFCN
jgi:hypothetical protein